VKDAVERVVAVLTRLEPLLQACPNSKAEFFDTAGRIIGQTAKHIGEPGARIDARVGTAHGTGGEVLAR
jgi:hypothetical protein